jgi:hypothetical protein
VSRSRCGWGVVPRLFMVAGTALILGCGTAPTAPLADAGPPVLVVDDDGAVHYRQAEVLEPRDHPRALTTSGTVEGQAGGWLQCGRFLLAIPAGAFDGTGTITMAMPDSTAMVVELTIAPEALNHFAAPVLLSLKTTDAQVPPDSLAIYWYDPAVSKWVGTPTEKSLASATDCLLTLNGGIGVAPLSSNDSGVSASLTHFSKYSAGKAGW